MANDTLFDLNTINQDEQTLQGPVTCLGMEFENDEARRAYFREELRKKLPELKKIEGYPIGEDDDIINLSDPPYYTACPNPWLNDFVAEWEKEKEQLEKEGKRSKDFEVKEPYASDVSEGKNNPVYTAHTYHTKVPHPAIMRYILQYTQPGDIVLDGFAGTGMTGVAAAACSNGNDEIATRINGEWMKQFGHRPNWGARHAIIGDLSPYATNIAYFYNTPVNVRQLKAEVERIQKEMEEECGWMYTTTNSKGEPIGRINFVVWSDMMVCPSCGKEYVFWNQAVDHEQECLHEEFHCPYCHAQQSKKTAKIAEETYFDEALQKPMKRVKQVPVIVVGKAGKEKIKREPTQFDYELLKKIEELKIDGFFPSTPLPEGLKTRDPKTKLIYYIHQFYTKRNLIALAKLNKKIEDSPMASTLKFLITAVAVWCTKTSRVKINYYFHGGGGWNIGVLSNTLYVPGFPVETSVLENFSNKIDSAIRALETLPQKYHNPLFTNSADHFSIADNSIDYIFTDPPFGANINYSELNSLPEPWLKVITNNGHEAIENTAQGKDAQHYRDTMTDCFREYYRVLKPGKWMTVEFSNTNAAVWNAIQSAMQYAGFIVTNVAALDKKQGSFNAVTSTTAVKQDLVITCYKPSEKTTELFEHSTDKSANAWDFVDELLHHLPVHVERNQSTTVVVERSPKILYDRLISYYVQHGYAVPMDAADFQAGLRERYMERDGMFFTADQAAQYEKKRNELPNGVQINAFMVGSEADGIQWLKNKLYDNPKTYQEILPEWMQAIAGVRRGDILPELRDLLEQNFIKEADGHWRLPDANDERDLEILRTKALLKEFNLYAEQAAKPKAKLKEVRVEALRAGFKQCYMDKDFATIVMVGDKIPENLLTEDEVLLQYYDIASSRV